LNGVVDYQDILDDRYIVVKIGDYYIGYNRAASFNAGVREAADQVTIVEKLGSADSTSRSKLVAKLEVGSFYTIQLTEDVGVLVEYVSNSDSKDAVIDIKLSGPAPVCQGEYDAEVEVVVTTDNYPTETSWGITNSGGQYIYKVEPSSLTSPGATYTDKVVGLCRGLQYYFIINDSYGDGMCCNQGSGNYKATFDGLEIFSGGEFDEQETKPFILKLESTPAPSPTPPTCVDNETKEFDIEIDGISKTKKCPWIASKKKGKRDEYCAMNVKVNGKSKKLKAICKETCGNCLSPKGEPDEPTVECVDNAKKKIRHRDRWSKQNQKMPLDCLQKESET